MLGLKYNEKADRNGERKRVETKWGSRAGGWYG